MNFLLCTESCTRFPASLVQYSIPNTNISNRKLQKILTQPHILYVQEINPHPDNTKCLPEGNPIKGLTHSAGLAPLLLPLRKRGPGLLQGISPEEQCMATAGASVDTVCVPLQHASRQLKHKMYSFKPTPQTEVKQKKKSMKILQC